MRITNSADSNIWCRIYTRKHHCDRPMRWNVSSNLCKSVEIDKNGGFYRDSISFKWASKRSEYDALPNRILLYDASYAGTHRHRSIYRYVQQRNNEYFWRGKLQTYENAEIFRSLCETISLDCFDFLFIFVMYHFSIIISSSPIHFFPIYFYFGEQTRWVPGDSYFYYCLFYISKYYIIHLK